MAPTIVLKDGRVFLVLGSHGGPPIITTVANVLIGVVDFSLDIQDAVNAPGFIISGSPIRFSSKTAFLPIQ